MVMNLEVFGDAMVMLGELKGEGEDFMPIKGLYMIVCRRSATFWTNNGPVIKYDWSFF